MAVAQTTGYEQSFECHKLALVAGVAASGTTTTGTSRNPTRTVQAPGVSGFNFQTTSIYDTLNRRASTTDARLGTTQFSYDGLDCTV